MRAFFDTNVLVYAFDCDELERRKKALSLLEQEAARGRVLLSTQVLEEFYVAVTRKLKRPLDEEAAEQATRHLARFAVVVIDPQLVFRGIVRSRVSRLSFWDSLILESAMEGKAEVLCA
jgi:predicted nucleic acid-binding protein